MPYTQALEEQREHRRAILDGRADSELWLLEHDKVITTGRRVTEGTASPEELAENGIDYFETERGGLATYHGPGQLVGYLLCDIGDYGLSVRATVCGLEQGIIHWLSGFGVQADRRDGFPGVWVGQDKIAAIGLHFRKGVSLHGFALNLMVDLADYRFIVPCGITDGGVTSLKKLRPDACPTAENAATSIAESIFFALGIPKKSGSFVTLERF